MTAEERIGIVLANTAISLDGFIAGPNHEMDWVFDHHFLPEGPIPSACFRPGPCSQHALTIGAVTGGVSKK